MQFKLQKSELLSALTNVSKAIPAKSQIKALEGVLFTLTQGEMKLTGYDLEQGIETTISAESFDTGKFIADQKIFKNVIAKMPSEEIDFSIEENTLTIASGKTNFTLGIMQAEEYPSLPGIENATKITISSSVLKSMISQTVFASAENSTRPILTGELFEIESNVLNVVAIDGFRMALRSEKIDAEDIKTVIPASCLKNVVNVLNSGDCDIYISAKYAKFVIGDYSVFTRLLDGEFHNYKNSLPKGHISEVTASTRELMNSLDRCSLLINDRIKSPVRCVFENGQIKIGLKTAIGKISETIQAETSGNTLEIGFNVRYMLDALKAVDSDKVTMYLSGANSPMTIKGEGYTFLVLPVRLKDE